VVDVGENPEIFLRQTFHLFQGYETYEAAFLWSLEFFTDTVLRVIFYIDLVVQQVSESSRESSG